MGPRKRPRRDPAAVTSSSPKTPAPARSESESTILTSQASGTSDTTATTLTAATTASASTSTMPPSQQDSVDSTPKPFQKLQKQVRDTVGAPTTGPQVTDGEKVHKSRSWYGSWPRVPKSSASTQVARETIHGGTLKPASSPDFHRFDLKRGSDLSSLDGANPSPSILPNVPESGPGQEDTDMKAPSLIEDNSAMDTTGDSGPKSVEPIATTQPEPALPELPPPPSVPSEVVQRPSTSSAWLGWFGRASEQEQKLRQTKSPENEPQAPEPTKEAPKEVAKDVPKEPPIESPQEEPQQTPTGGMEGAAPAANPQQEKPVVSGASWFGFWSTSTGASNTTSTGHAPQQKPNSTTQPKEPEDVVMEDAPPQIVSPPDPPAASRPSAGSTWAFWSRDIQPKSGGQPAPGPEQGQLAVIGESSEFKPKRANSIEVNGTASKDTPSKLLPKDIRHKETPSKEATLKEGSSKKNKRLRPQSMEIDEPFPVRPSTPKTEPVPRAESPAKPGSSKAQAPTKIMPPNLLLPPFRSTYHMKENPSILRQIAQLLLRTQQPPTNHVFLAQDPPKINKALAVGVHGLFPSVYLRPMIGQPTGTSIKFANHCAEAIRRWTETHGCEDCEIEKIALEGEGKIADRVENLWKLLLNWIDHIRRADLIILACHSQGVPVAIMLLAKLIELGIITTARIGVCAMAGVSLGPFPDYRSGVGMLMGSAAELWEFANPESEVSKRYEASLKVVLAYGVRITYVGSIDDQLVPLESAIYSPAHHPYIYRAAFIDGRIHAPDFIAHLVGFALKLRNLGVSDHGLIRELSIPLAGSLYSGEGHSRLYDDDQVYDLAVTHALETTNVAPAVPCEIHKHEGISNPNPYLLPWTMRGLLEEDFVKTELSAETAELLRQFDDWKPVTKALKDVKYRLEAVRSMSKL